MPRLLLWREVRGYEQGKVKLKRPPGPLVQDVLLAAAKDRPPLRPAFVRVLLTAPAGIFAPLPNISDRDLVAALRVTHQLQTSRDWRAYHKAVLRLLLDKGWYGPPIGSQDVRRCKMVMRDAAAYWGADTAYLSRELDEIGAAWHHNSRPQRRNPGRPMDESTRRILVAVRFLRTCGESRAEEKVSDALGELPGRHVAPESIRRAIAKFRKSRGKAEFEEWTDTQLQCLLFFLSSYLMPLIEG